MRSNDATARVSAEQDAVASTGVKGMIPIGRPFLEYAVSALADAGITDVVLVTGPEHEAVRDHFSNGVKLSRVSVRHAIQKEPRGTADAVCAAADVIGLEPFLVVNADNYYPPEALRILSSRRVAATIAFDRDALVKEGNITAERVRAFAVLDVSDDDRLMGIVEKPGESLDLTSERARWVGMNCWAITAEVVSACRRVPLSARGEFELPEAVALAIREGTDVRVSRIEAGVLDLSHRSDIDKVAAALSAVTPSL